MMFNRRRWQLTCVQSDGSCVSRYIGCDVLSHYLAPIHINYKPVIFAKIAILIKLLNKKVTIHVNNNGLCVNI